MGYGNKRNALSEEERREFLRALGVGGAVAVGGFTFDELRGAVGTGGSDELAAVGEAIRADLTGLDEALLGTELAAIEGQFDRLAELRAAGTLAEPGSVYREVTAPAWTVYEHLVDAGFFESAEVHLPRFTEAYVASSARELVRAEPIEAILLDLGFDETEALALVADVVTSSERLAWWVPTADLPTDVDEYDPENVAPLHQRAAGGALLWIDELDQHLWQRRRLITDEMLDAGFRDVRAMLGGFHLMTTAARDLAGPADLTDSQLTATLTTAAAIMIVGQEDVAADLFRITDEMRAPREGI